MAKLRKSKSQIKKEKLEKQQLAQKQQKLARQLSSMTLFGTSSPKETKRQEYTRPINNVRYDMDTSKLIPSNDKFIVDESSTVKVELTPELQEREKLAQAELKRKSMRTAPLYNKGAYQYIGDSEDLTTIGKKI